MRAARAGAARAGLRGRSCEGGRLPPPACLPASRLPHAIEAAVRRPATGAPDRSAKTATGACRSECAQRAAALMSSPPPRYRRLTLWPYGTAFVGKCRCGVPESSRSIAISAPLPAARRRRRCCCCCFARPSRECLWMATCGVLSSSIPH